MKALRALFYLLLLANLVLAFLSLSGFSRAPGGEPDRLSGQLHPEQIRILSSEETTAESEPAAPDQAAQSAVPETAQSAAEPADPGRKAEEEKKAAEERKAAEAKKLEAKKVEEQKRAEEAKKAEAKKVEAKKAEEAKKLAAEASAPACASWAGLNRVQADELIQMARSAGLKTRELSSGVATAWWVHLPPQTDRAGAERKAAELRKLGVNDFFIVSEAGASQNAISLGLYKNEDSAKRMLEQLRASGVQSAQISARGPVQVRVEVSGANSALTAFSGRSRVPGAHASCSPR